MQLVYQESMALHIIAGTCSVHRDHHCKQIMHSMLLVNICFPLFLFHLFTGITRTSIELLCPNVSYVHCDALRWHIPQLTKPATSIPTKSVSRSDVNNGKPSNSMLVEEMQQKFDQIINVTKHANNDICNVWLTKQYSSGINGFVFSNKNECSMIRNWHMLLQTLCVHSSDGNNFLHEMMPWPLSLKYDFMPKIWLC